MRFGGFRNQGIQVQSGVVGMNIMIGFGSMWNVLSKWEPRIKTPTV